MSTVVPMRLVLYSAISTASGASAENPGSLLDDPKCRQSGKSASSQAEKTSSQWFVWKDGSPSGAGFSGKVMPRAPLAATRWISLTHSCGSQTGSMASGMKRPGAEPDHSSTEKSFQAVTQASARSLSSDCRKTRPANPGNDG